MNYEQLKLTSMTQAGVKGLNNVVSFLYKVLPLLLPLLLFLLLLLTTTTLYFVSFLLNDSSSAAAKPLTFCKNGGIRRRRAFADRERSTDGTLQTEQLEAHVDKQEREKNKSQFHRKHATADANLPPVYSTQSG